MKDHGDLGRSVKVTDQGHSTGNEKENVLMVNAVTIIILISKKRNVQSGDEVIFNAVY